MTTDAASGASAASSFVTDTVRQSTTQLLGIFSQSTKFTFGTLSAVAKALSKVPPRRPSIPMAPTKEALQQWLDVGFDSAEQLFKLQRELIAEMVDRLGVLGTAE